MFYCFHQNNSYGTFDYDEKAGISVNVIVEASNYDEANSRARSIGLYFGGYGDCSCCGDRWYEQDSYSDPKDFPHIYGTEVKPGDLMPAADSTGWTPVKWMPEGKPEGFIHYLDGRIEPFHATTAERQDLEGQYGWGVNFNKYKAQTFLCGKNGWDETGNLSAPWAKYAFSSDPGAGVPPDDDSMIVKKDGHGSAWFRNEADAIKFAEEYKEVLKQVKKNLRYMKVEGADKDILSAVKRCFK